MSEVSGRKDNGRAGSRGVWRRRRMYAMGSVSAGTIVLTVGSVATRPRPTNLATGPRARPTVGATLRLSAWEAERACRSVRLPSLSAAAENYRESFDRHAALQDGWPLDAFHLAVPHRGAYRQQPPLVLSATDRICDARPAPLFCPGAGYQSRPDRRQGVLQAGTGRHRRRSIRVVAVRHPCGSSGGLTWRPPGSPGGNPPRPTSVCRRRPRTATG